MSSFSERKFVGERALFNSKDLIINSCVFCDGESPLKESRNLKINNSIFRWKYPLWYCNDVILNKSTLLETARSGIWYTNNISIYDSIIEAPKTFRRSSNIKLVNCFIPNAEETLWSCDSITMDNVKAAGDYFGMNSKNIKISEFNLSGNYSFDGATNIEIDNAFMNSKDAFWNCDNVLVKNSTIIGEYLGWNSKNITFINCNIESLQGMCYIDNIKLIDCNLINTTLCFEYSTVDAKINSKIDSVKNPYSGTIISKGVEELILEADKVDVNKTKIIIEE